MLLKKGSTGANVKYLQYGLKIMCCNPGAIDGNFGTGTYNAVVKYQKSKGLTADGVVGDGTWNKLKADIKNIQKLLNNHGYGLTVDGVAGSSTYNAVIKFQKSKGLTADGMVGASTLKALKKSGSTTPTQPTKPTTPKGSLVSNKLVDFIKDYEKFSSKAYDDGTGVMTIGYGTTRKECVAKGTCTKEEATKWFHEDLNAFSKKIKNELDKKKVTLKQCEFDALASFAYNCGVGALINKSTLWKNVIAGVRDSKTITANFQAWCNANGKRSNGLYKRRTQEANMFLKGVYDSTH